MLLAKTHLSIYLMPFANRERGNLPKCWSRKISRHFVLHFVKFMIFPFFVCSNTVFSIFSEKPYLRIYESVLKNSKKVLKLLIVALKCFWNFEIPGVSLIFRKGLILLKLQKNFKKKANRKIQKKNDFPP